MAECSIDGIKYILEKDGKAYKIDNGKKQEIKIEVFNKMQERANKGPKATIHHVDGSKSGWFYAKFSDGKIVYFNDKHQRVGKDVFMEHEKAFMTEDGEIKAYNLENKALYALKGIGNFFADMVTSEQPVPKIDNKGNVVQDSHGNPVYERNANGTPKTKRKFDLARTATTVVVGAAIGVVCVATAPVLAACGVAAGTAAAIGTGVQVAIGGAFVLSGGKKMLDAELENQRDDITNEQKIKNWESKGSGTIEAILGALMMKGGAKSYGKNKAVATDAARGVELRNRASYAKDGKLSRMTDLKNRYAAVKASIKNAKTGQLKEEKEQQNQEKLSDSRPKTNDPVETQNYIDAVKKSNDKGQLKAELKDLKKGQKTSDVQKQIKELEKKIEKDTKEIEQAREKLKNANEQEAEALNKKVSDLEQSVNADKSKLTDLKTKAGEESNSARQQQIKAVEERLQELEAQEKQIQEIENALKDSNAEPKDIQAKIDNVADPKVKARLQAKLNLRRLDLKDQEAINAFIEQNSDNAVALDELASAIEKTKDIKPEDKAPLLRDIYKRQHDLEPDVYPDVEAEIAAREAAKTKNNKPAQTQDNQPADGEPKPAEEKSGGITGWFKKGWQSLTDRFNRATRDLRAKKEVVKHDDGSTSTRYIDKKTGNVYKEDFGKNGICELKYDSDGNITLEVWRDAKGKFAGTREYKCLEGSDQLYKIERDASGKVTRINDYTYDSEGNLTRIGNTDVYPDLDVNGNGYWFWAENGAAEQVHPTLVQRAADLYKQFPDAPKVEEPVSLLSGLKTQAKGILDRFRKPKEKLTAKEVETDNGKIIEYRNSEGKLVKEEVLEEGYAPRTDYYDADGNCVKSEWPLGSTEKYYYDNNGKRVKTEASDWWGLKKRNREYLYEDTNYPNKPTMTITRGKNNKVLSITDNKGSHQYTYEYDSNGNLTEITVGKGDNASTVKITYKDGKPYNDKGNPISDGIVQRAKECWDKAQGNKPEIAEAKPIAGSPDSAVGKDTQGSGENGLGTKLKEKVRTTLPNKTSLAAGGAVTADNKVDSMEMAEAIAQTQADEEAEDDIVETDDEPVDDAEETNETDDEPFDDAEETNETDNEPVDDAEETNETDNEPVDEAEETNETDNEPVDEAEETNETDNAEEASNTEETEETEATGDPEVIGGNNTGDEVSSDPQTDNDAAATGNTGSGNGTGITDDTSTVPSNRGSNVSGGADARRSSGGTRRNDGASSGRTNGAGRTSATGAVTGSRTKSRTDTTGGSSSDDNSSNSSSGTSRITPQERFSITQQVQDAKTKEEIANALRTLREAGRFQGRRNLRRLLKTKRKALEVKIDNKPNNDNKYDSKINKLDTKVEN